MMTIERPKTKLWVCTNCGDLYELERESLPPRGVYGEVLCHSCAEERA
jgi:hypothetical protein